MRRDQDALSGTRGLSVDVTLSCPFIAALLMQLADPERVCRVRNIRRQRGGSHAWKQPPLRRHAQVSGTRTTLVQLHACCPHLKGRTWLHLFALVTSLFLLQLGRHLLRI